MLATGSSAIQQEVLANHRQALAEIGFISKLNPRVDSG